MKSPGDPEENLSSRPPTFSHPLIDIELLLAAVAVNIALINDLTELNHATHMNEILLKVTAEVLVAATTALVTFIFTRHRYKLKYDAAAKQYTRRIGEQIQRPSFSDSDLEVQARSIVAVRDDLRGSLLELSKTLNSDIDVLKELLSAYQQSRNPENLERIRISVEVLKRKWPIKSEQIANEIRKLLTELGFVEA